MWGVRWTCIHVLMHAHILTKVWNPDIWVTGAHTWGQRGAHNGMHRGTHICAQPSKVDEANVESQVDMHTCTYICSQSIPGVDQNRDAWYMHTGHICLHTAMQRRWSKMWGVRWTYLHVLMHVHSQNNCGTRGLPRLPRNRSTQCNHKKK